MPSHTHDIICIGGSAGSRGPLRAILGGLPAGLPSSVLVVTHMATRGANWLAESLRGHGTLPMHVAADGETLGPGQVLLASPDRHLVATSTGVRLGLGPRENMARPAVDALFRSAAVAYGPRVVGVVLSGMLDDGAAGLDAIRQCGGVTVVQDPEEAEAPSMPRAALEACGGVDHCLPAAAIAPLLASLSRREAGTAAPPSDLLRMEVEIALGGAIDPDRLREVAAPSVQSCPDCNGVLSEVRGARPLRFRCQIGHATTAEVLLKERERATSEALRVAMRMMQERVNLVRRMAEDARANGRNAVAAMFDEREKEYRSHLEALRAAVLSGMAAEQFP